MNELRGIKVLLAGFVVSLAFLSGCASLSPGKVTGDPSEVTVENALKSVGRGLAEMRAEIGKQKTGLIPSEITVNFKLAASAKDASKLTVDLSVPLTSGGAAGTAKVGGEIGGSSEGSRGNEITIKFVNLLTLGKDTLIQNKSAADLQALLKAVDSSGIVIFFKAQER
jgi:hypothetical protein